MAWLTLTGFPAALLYHLCVLGLSALNTCFFTLFFFLYFYRVCFHVAACTFWKSLFSANVNDSLSTSERRFADRRLSSLHDFPPSHSFKSSGFFLLVEGWVISSRRFQETSYLSKQLNSGGQRGPLCCSITGSRSPVVPSTNYSYMVL